MDHPCGRHSTRSRPASDSGTQTRRGRGPAGRPLPRRPKKRRMWGVLAGTRREPAAPLNKEIHECFSPIKRRS
jgi:hypothetical protein